MKECKLPPDASVLRVKDQCKIQFVDNLLDGVVATLLIGVQVLVVGTLLSLIHHHHRVIAFAVCVLLLLRKGFFENGDEGRNKLIAFVVLVVVLMTMLLGV